MSKFERTPPSQGDFTGRAQGGGRPRTSQGHGGGDAPEFHGGTRWGQAADSLRETAFIMEDPRMVRSRGRPPRNYQRSDERIREDICEHLMHERRVDPSDVSVEVRDGTVFLEGTVPERRMKYVIEDIAAECLGANDVENRIRVARHEEGAGAAAAARSEGINGSAC